MTSDDMTNAAKDIAGWARMTGDSAAEAAKKAAAGGGEMARDFTARAKDAVADHYDRARDGFRSAADHIPKSGTEAIATGQRAFARSNDAIGRQVTKQPLEALLLAGAIGYLVGWAANRS